MAQSNTYLLSYSLCGSGLWVWVIWIFCSVSQQAEIKVLPGAAISYKALDLHSSSLVVGRIHFHVVLEPRTSAPKGLPLFPDRWFFSQDSFFLFACFLFLLLFLRQTGIHLCFSKSLVFLVLWVYYFGENCLSHTFNDFFAFIFRLYFNMVFRKLF